MQEFDLIPSKYLCPITRKIFVDPVIATDGITYEREAIEDWFEKNGTSYQSGDLLLNKTLTPNMYAVRDVDEFRTTHPDIFNTTDRMYIPRSWLKSLAQAIEDDKINDVESVLSKTPRLLVIDIVDGRNALQLAAERGTVESTGFILDASEKSVCFNEICSAVKPEGWYPINLMSVMLECLEAEDFDRLTLLSSIGANVNCKELESGDSCLHKLVLAPHKYNEPALDWLMSNGADLECENADGDTPLLVSSRENNLSGAAWLISHGASISHRNHKHESPVSACINRVDKAMLAVLCGADIAALPMLHVAIQLGDAELLNFFLDNDEYFPALYIDRYDCKQCTPLYLAVAIGNTEAVKMLVAAGADILKTCTAQEFTPLHRAIVSGHLELTQYFLTLPYTPALDMDALDTDGLTLLHVAVRERHIDIMNALICTGASPHARNKEGRTALEYAADLGHSSLITMMEYSERKLKRGRYDELKQLESDVAAQRQRIDQLEKCQETDTEKINYLQRGLREVAFHRERSLRHFQSALTVLKGVLPQFDITKVIEPSYSYRFKEIIGNHETRIRDICEHPKGRLSSVSVDKHIKLWTIDINTAPLTLQSKEMFPHCLLALSDKLLAAGFDDGAIRVLRCVDGKCIRIMRPIKAASLPLPPAPPSSPPTGLPLTGTNTAFTSTAATVSSHTAAISSDAMQTDSEVEIVTVSSNRLPGVTVMTPAPRSSESSFASGDEEGTIYIWPRVEVTKSDLSAEKGHLSAVTQHAAANIIGAHTGAVKALVTSTYGSLVSACELDWDIKVWAITGDAAGVLCGHRGGVSCLAVLPRDEIASASIDTTVKIWSLFHQLCLRTLTIAPNWASSSLVLAPCGALASDGPRGTIMLWDYEINKKMNEVHLRKEHGQVMLLLSTKSAQLVAVTTSNLITLWDRVLPESIV